MIFENKNNVYDCNHRFPTCNGFFLMKMSFGGIENIPLVPKYAVYNQPV